MKSFLSRERKEPLSYKVNRIISKLLCKETFWDYDLNGEGFDNLEFKTLSEARADAESFFHSKCEESGSYANGETDETDCTYIQFFYDDNDGIHIMREVNEIVTYEHYHGDRAEHFSQRDYI